MYACAYRYLYKDTHKPTYIHVCCIGMCACVPTYICMYVRMHTCCTYMCYVYTYMCVVSACMHACLCDWHACMCMCLCVCVSLRVCQYVRVHTYICACVCVCVHVYCAFVEYEIRVKKCSNTCQQKIKFILMTDLTLLKIYTVIFRFWYGHVTDHNIIIQVNTRSVQRMSGT